MSKKLKDNVDLQYHILDCWRLTEALDFLSESILEETLEKEDIVDVLKGLKITYERKFDILHSQWAGILTQDEDWLEK